MDAHRKESGQAVVLIVLAIVAMVGFVGLAVDGGRIYSEQRRAQNAADAAAYAAAMAAIDEQDVMKAALDQAELNDYATAGSTTVNVYNPPIEGQYKGDDKYYQVVIERNLGATFGRAVGMTTYTVRSVSVVHARPIDPVNDPDDVIHSLDDDGTGIEIKGGGSLNVTGGNVRTNAALKLKDSSRKIKVTDGGVFYNSKTGPQRENSDAASISPEPQLASQPLYPAAVPEANCGSAEYSPLPDNTQTVFEPGTYLTKLNLNGGNVTFKRGLYCLKNGLEVVKDTRVSGKDVVFILKGGNFATNNAVDMRLTRPNDLEDPSGNQWGGMLIYAPSSNASGIVDLNGKGNVTYAGTVYAPSGWCRIGGAHSTMTIKSNIVCNKILFHGNADITFDYKPSQNYQLPPMLELSE